MQEFKYDEENGNFLYYRDGELIAEAPLPKFDEHGNITNDKLDGNLALIMLSTILDG